MIKLLIILVYLRSLGLCQDGNNSEITTTSTPTPTPPPPIIRKPSILFLTEFGMTKDVEEMTNNFFNEYEMTNSVNVSIRRAVLSVDRMQFPATQLKFCAALKEGLSIVIDTTVTGQKIFYDLAKAKNIPYMKMTLTNFEYTNASLHYVMAKYGKDLAIVFQNEIEADMGLYNVIAMSTLRVIVMDQFTDRSLIKMKALRPMPSFFVIIASTENMNRLFQMALDAKIVEREERWILQFTDYNTQNFKYDIYNDFPAISKLVPNPETCCRWLSLPSKCECPEHFSTVPYYYRTFLSFVVDSIAESNYPAYNASCFENNVSSNSTFFPKLIDAIKTNNLLTFYDGEDVVQQTVDVSIIANHNDSLSKSVPIARYTNMNIETLPQMEILSAKRFFRVGTMELVPWAYLKRNPVTKAIMRDSKNRTIWEGYCIDLAQRLSEVMEFNYEFVSPSFGVWGERMANGKWNGLIGDLIRGDADIAVAPLKMTAEREEVIDFIAPYFEQTGISIVMRKPVRQTSLFKFMTVLRLEVWLSIVGALVATAILIWLLDKYSPYSARNNKEAYPYPCREFTLKESFWFALTSFTPQGGGEAPKSISGRTLVAAYWLFVVLMLATFTANLAAFLTVERMQTPVQSLEQLARQSRINYTVVEGSDTHQYFKNMKNAEDTLYRVWKEITLNSTSDKAEYRVWDYPIKEQYSHILMAIDSAMPMQTSADGFRKVNEMTDADFAFIHDSAEIKYEISRNCNLTEVGEVFAEQPYALAVQQGSHLQDELSRAILNLQKDRFFEDLYAKYWNNSVKGECPNSDDSEGITLESLGGVFIATLFGLALAMITLVGEVFYYRKKERQEKILKVQPRGGNLKNNLNQDFSKPSKFSKQPSIPKDITIGNNFVPASKARTRVSFISIFSQRNNGNRIDAQPIE